MRPARVCAILVGTIAVLGASRWRQGHRGNTCGTGALESALIGDQAVLDHAIRLYRDEHGRYPSLGGFVEQMTSCTSFDGEARATPDFVHGLGPYLRRVPPVPKGPRSGCAKVGADGAPDVG